jgi:hypothetical protein
LNSILFWRKPFRKDSDEKRFAHNSEAGGPSILPIQGGRRRPRHLRAGLQESGRPATGARQANQTVLGGGFLKSFGRRFAVFGSWNASTDKAGPATVIQVGGAGAF